MRTYANSCKTFDFISLRPEFVPQDLQHRDGQTDHLSSVLKLPGFELDENVCLFGPSGAGKTTVVKYTLGQLEQQAIGIRLVYVNCMADSTTGAALFQLVRDIGLGADLRREGLSTAQALDRLRDYDDRIRIEALSQDRIL